jgi:geranylgeranyl diphosphate synthase, type II
MDLSNKINMLLRQIEAGLAAHVPPATTRPERLHQAMRYSLEAGGKRLRPMLVLAAAELGDTSKTDPMPAAVAVECVHTYSLIHDDLPCMDDDDLRRGRPTAHRQFDEATALLAGDALLTHAFALLARAYAADPVLSRHLIDELADAAGSRRLIGGQMADLQAEEKTDATAEELDFIHLNKTGAMLEASLVMGAQVGGLSEPQGDSLRAVGRALGLAFQIVDDVLDATADTATLGKTAGKDARAGKTTYVRLHGLEESRRRIAQLTESASEHLRGFGERSSFLQQLAQSLAHRAK